ncbi:hypothetical protein PAXRUDRAFT_835494, partial [Paxillus rubicundulus Ve08.2h10]
WTTNVIPNLTPPPPSITTTQPYQSSSWHPRCTYCRTHYQMRLTRREKGER